MINLDDLAMDLNETARAKGFWDQDTEEFRINFYLKQIAMIHSEGSEILEAVRKQKGDDQVVEEIADLIIRALDLFGGMVRDGYTELSLHKSLLNKAQINTERPRMHGVLA